jgi:starch synthase
MAKPKVLFVCEEIYPYLKKSPISEVGRYLPQHVQENGKEIRVFLPRFGNINERRNQLHEVIRLSGMNLIINDLDHPLIIKVASIQLARMQVYFIDNEDYFQRKFVFRDAKSKFFKDNDERAIFYARGVLETVKKLNWAPDLVHIHGWFGSLVPMYLQKIFNSNPLFSEAKIITSLYNDDFEESFPNQFTEHLELEGLKSEDLGHYKDKNYVGMMKAAIDHSHAIVISQENVNPELIDYAKASGKPMLDYIEGDVYKQAYNEFYDSLLEGKDLED